MVYFIAGFIFMYIAGVLFTVLSEIFYKKRSIESVIKDYKSIVWNFTLIFIVSCIAFFLYYIFGIKAQ